MRREVCYCASCQFFPLDKAAESGGKAVCEWFGERGWNYPACVLHSPATDREARKRIVIQLMKSQQNQESM